MAPKGSLLLFLIWICGTLAFGAQEVPVEILHSFSRQPWGPNSPLTRGSDGNFYGTTSRGGDQESGTVYRLTPDGKTELVASLPARSFIKGEPGLPLTITNDGQIYGVVSWGGANGWGFIFRIKDGLYETVVDFERSSPDHGATAFTGYTPRSPLLMGEDGYLYGTTEKGGTSDTGTIFRISNEGVITKLGDFGKAGIGPMGALVRTADGTIYGTTRHGGSSQVGTVFKLTANGTLSTVYQFGYQTGYRPESGLFQGPDGLFYGTTSVLGTYNGGTLFSINTSGVLTVLAHFPSNPRQARPGANLVFGANGSIFGISGFDPFRTANTCTIFKYTPGVDLSFVTPPTAFGVTTGLTSDGTGKLLSVLEYTGGNSQNGVIFRSSATGEFETAGELKQQEAAYPSSLLRAPDGTIYGSTLIGGPNNAGTLFKISPDGTYSTLASFDRTTVGYGPQGLRFGADGRIYGITTKTGTAVEERASFFRLNEDNTLSVLHNYSAETGFNSHLPTLGADDAFYIPTNDMGPDGGGTILHIPSGGPSAILHSFTNTTSQPRNPASSLFPKPDGSLIGTLWQSGEQGKGAIYRIDSAGTFNLLGSFSTDPSFVAHLLHSDGNLYGATLGYAAESSLYRVTQSGTVSLLAALSPALHGSGVIGLTEASDHNLYGTSALGGSDGRGTIFRATLNGTVTAIARRFRGTVLGFDVGTFVEGGDGYLYGAQSQGGPNGGGVVFRIKLPATPSVTTKLVFVPNRTKATLQAVANNSLFEASVRFEYGTDSSYGSSTPEQSLAGDLDEQAFNASVALSPGTAYHFRAVMVADGKTYYGEDQQFTTPQNHAPSAGNDVGLLRVPDSVLIDVTANDQDADDDALAITAFTQGSYGTVTQEGNSLRYSPDGGFAGADSFTYTISDGFASTTATVLIRNPLHRGQGIYQPRLLDAKNSTRGTLKLTLSPAGEFNGRMVIKGTAWEFNGTIGLDGAWSGTVTSGGKTATVDLQLDTTTGLDLLHGTITIDGKSYSLTPEASGATPETIAALAGRHNAILPSPDDAVPQGTGWISMVVQPNGNVRLAGVLGDGSPFTAGTRLTGDGRVPISIRLPAKLGDLVSGEIQLAATPDQSTSGTLNWFKPERPKAASFPEGFDVMINALSSRYSVPAKGTQSLTYSTPTNATADLLLFSPSTGPGEFLLNVSPKDAVLTPDTQGLQMTIDRSTGVFRGAFKPKGAAKTSFSGVLLQSENRGKGLFGQGSTAGTATLMPK